MQGLGTLQIRIRVLAVTQVWSLSPLTAQPSR